MTNPIDDANTGPTDNQPAPAPAEPGTQPPATDPQPQPEESTPDYQKLYEQLQGQARKWETRAKTNADKAKKWDQTEAANRTEAEQATDRASQAEARAQTAITAAVNAEIRAAALGWANPADAPRYLDDKTKYVGEDGEIDTTAIAEDVAAVLTERPHLAAPSAEKRRGPSPDPAQGSRGTATVAEQIRDAEKRGDHREALRLKTANMLGGNR
ncbi:hypothetical protein [Actinophytocola sediminis]